MKKQLAEFINTQISNRELAGASLSIIKNGQTIFQEEYGYANIEQRVPIKENTIFHMYSMTKPVTSMAIMMLWERGQLALTDSVSKYLEGFSNQKVVCGDELVEVEREVTVKDLLNMTSGIPYPSEENESARQMKIVFDEAIKKAKTKEAMTTIELCNRIGQVPLMFQPGTGFLYGASADILGAIVEVISGMSYRSFLKKEIFEPLGMVDTDFYAPENKKERVATIYHCDEKRILSKPYEGEELIILNENMPPSFESGGAGLYSTIEDYKKFALLLLGKGMYEGKRYIKEETMEYMATNQLTKEQALTLDWPHLQGHGYGNLMRVLLEQKDMEGNGNLGEFGWDGWAGTYVAIDPEEDLVILYYIQRMDKEPSFERNAIRSIVYTNLEKVVEK